MATLASVLHLHPRGHAAARGYQVARPHFDKLPGGAYRLIAGGYSVMLLAFWLLFVGDRESALSVFAATMITGIGFGIPRLVALIGSHRRHDPFGRLAEWRVPRRPRLRDFLDGEMDTYSGPLSGWSALIHVALIPVALACAAIGIGIVFALT